MKRRLAALASLLMLATAALALAHAAYIPAKAVLAQWLLVHAWEQRGTADGVARPWPGADMRPLARLSQSRLDIDQIDPIHFKPAIDSATDAQCLACHEEVLQQRVREVSPAGVRSDQALAWYQTLSTYEGEQETFHRRHIVTPYAERVMQLRCNTCHQGNDPREETANSSATGNAGLTQRKQVDRS